MSSSGSARGGLPVASKPGSASGPLLVDCVSDAIWFAVLVGACAMPSPRSPPVPWVAARVAHNFTDRCPHPTLPRKRGREPLPLQSPAGGGGRCLYNRRAIRTRNVLAGLTLTIATLTLGSPIAMAASTDWPTYHRDTTRGGNDTASPAFSGLAPQWSSIHLDNNAFADDMNAEPLVVGSRVIVATVANTVYSLDAGTGAVQWSINVGAPARSSDVNCGPQDPVGMQGTPVVDIANGIVYAVALVKTGGTPALQYYLIGLDLNTGTRKFADLPITVSGLNPLTQGQRGALAFSAAAGKVYIPFGGRDG